MNDPKKLASKGRYGDTMLAHINPEEAALLKSRGGAGTINPKTGLPEFYQTGSPNSPWATSQATLDAQKAAEKAATKKAAGAAAPPALTPEQREAQRQVNIVRDRALSQTRGGRPSGQDSQFYQPAFQPQYTNYTTTNPLGVSQYGTPMTARSLVDSAYAGIGRYGSGNETNQVDPGGRRYWENSLNSGALNPQNFFQTFGNSVQDYQTRNPNDRYTQYTQNQTGYSGADFGRGYAQQPMPRMQTPFSYQQPMQQRQAPFNPYTNQFETYDQIVKNQYAKLGRTGFGSNTDQIDPEGFNYFVNQLQTQQMDPSTFASKFDATAQEYMRNNPNDRYTKYVQQFQQPQQRQQMQTPFSYQQPQYQQQQMQSPFSYQQPSNNPGGGISIQGGIDPYGNLYGSMPYHYGQGPTPLSYQQPQQRQQMQTPFSYQQPQYQQQMQTPFSYQQPMQQPMQQMQQPMQQPAQTNYGPSQAIVGRSSQMRGTPNVMRRAQGGIASLFKKNK